PRASVDSRWLAYLVASNPVVEWAVATSDGTKMPRTSWEKLAEYRIDIPPTDEQRAIADYLDREIARIDALIEKKQRMLDLLRERRQALITEAVQGEIGPETVARGGGVKTVPLKRVVALTAGQSPPSADVMDSSGEGLPFLQGNAEFGRYHPQPLKRCDSAPRHARPQDILVSIRAPVGALNIADREYGIGRGLCAVCPVSIDQRFCWWLLHAAIPTLASMAVGSTYDAVTGEDVGSLPVPSWSEATQRAIANYLDRETARIDALVEKTDHQIELLREHRQALITVAVTGELQIQGVAA
ncbi:MAG: restriction endonuclease subunit S, partial [Actinobacteria bacterium]|nr:restriction endonuclease subunit S [Actinomycetota bacterium]